MIKITCTSCQKPLSLDETKLPMREVTFPCPVCKQKLIVDRRTLGEGEEAPAGAAATAPAVPSHAGEHDEDHANEFGAKALIVGVDNPLVRHAAKLIGYLPVYYAEAAKAREFYMQEFPQVIFIQPAQMTPPPLESMSPLISLVPSDRRKTFIVLIADNLRTLDGNAAFLYGVNLVVATKDLPQFPQVYRDAHTFHERFYGAVTAVLKEKGV